MFNTKQSSPGEGKLPLKFGVIEIEQKPFFREPVILAIIEVKGCLKRNQSMRESI